jgi:hypothetical protein
MKLFKKLRKKWQIFWNEKKALKKAKNDFPLPSRTQPYDQCLKKQNRRFLFSFLLLLGTSLFYSYYATQQKIIENELINIWVAKKSLTPPIKIEKKHLEAKYFPRKNLPLDFLEAEKNILGKTLIERVVENQIFMSHHFAESIAENSISTKFQNLFALTMDEDWFEAKLPELVKNDVIDILITNPKRNIKETVLIAKDLSIIEVQQDPKSNKKTLVVNTTEDSARAILFVRGAHLPMQILVHSSIPSAEIKK